MYGEVGSRELSIRIVIIQRAEIVNRRDAEAPEGSQRLIFLLCGEVPQSKRAQPGA